MDASDQLTNPVAVSPGIVPFWFWNGRMEDSEIVRQIDEMAEARISGFFICPRQGLEVPYLSSCWFKKVRIALERARMRGLEAWIYDEYPYPSGMAGGKIAMRHPDARHCSLEHIAVSAEGGGYVRREIGSVRILSARAVPVDRVSGREDWSAAEDVSDCIGILQQGSVYQKTGLTAYNQKRFFSSDPVKVFCWDVPDGEWTVHLFFEREISNFKYYGSYMDPCNEAAVRTFIRLTHERYFKEVGEYFGTTLRGFYTDETGLIGETPWSPSLPAYFLERNGYSICDNLQSLFCEETENSGQIRYDYFQTLHLLLRERYHRPISEWCRKHGLTYVSETPSLRATTQLCAGLPAADSGHEKLGVPLRDFLRKNGSFFRYNPKNASSVASQCGHSQVLVECFHSVGWSMTLQDAKWMLDRFLAMGVSIFNLHAFFYTTDGLRKHDAPPSLFFQNPYWEHFRLFADFASRAGALLQKSTPLCSVALLDPVTSLWAKMGNPLEGFSYCGGGSSEKAELEQLKSDWVEMGVEMLTALRDYHHLDPEMLASAETEQGMLCLGTSRYKVLMLPPLLNLEAAAWAVIKRFVDAGGTVLAYGLLPSQKIEKDGVDPEEVRELFGADPAALDAYWQGGADSAPRASGGHARAIFVPKIQGQTIRDVVREMLGHADRLAPPELLFEAETPSDSFLVHARRRSPSCVLIFAANQEDGTNRITFSGVSSRLGWTQKEPSDEPVFRELDLETGEYRLLSGLQTDGHWSVARDFGPYQSRLIQVEYGVAISAAEADPSEPGRISFPAQGDWDWRLEGENCLRLDRFDFWIDDSLVAREVGAKPFINICQEEKIRLRLEYEQDFGAPVSLRPAYPVRCRFETVFTASTKGIGSCHLVIEERAIKGNLSLFLNGVRLPGDIHNAGSMDIRSLLADGENLLCIEGEVRADEEGLRGALYLEGDFGVDLQPGSPPGIVPLVQDAVEFPVKGLGPCPYYAGTILLSKKVDLANLPEEPVVRVGFEHLDGGFHHCAELLMNGVSLGVRAWLPYEWTARREQLKIGENLLGLRITTSLEGKFEGCVFDYTSGASQNVRGAYSERTTSSPGMQ
jgi:hypothetical protein